MIERIDQMNRCVRVVERPQRIVSLVPSQTELLVDLGLTTEIVGITKFCIHPKEFKRQTNVVGGTKDFKLDKIRSLKPDLIIGNKEENHKEGIESLAQDFPVWMSDIKNLADALEMMELVGELVGRQEEAVRLAEEISRRFKALRPKPSKRCVYLTWNDPIIAVGPETFIHDMLQKSGFENVVSTPRYPQLTSEILKSLNPEVLLLSSEPFPFQEKHRTFFKELIPDCKIVLVDGEMFSWYGSRLLHSPVYFNQLKF